MTIQFDHTLVAGIIAALLFSAFFSGLEIAFVSSNKMLFEIEREERGFTSRIIDIFYRHQSNFLSTLLVGNNIALVVYGIMMAHIVHGLILQLFRINPNGMLRVCAVPALLFYIILWPMSRLTSGLSSAILYMMGTRVKSDVRPANFGKADLDHLIQSNIDNIQDEDDIEEEVKMFQNALAFRDIKVRECIVPRTEIVAVGLDAQLLEIRSQFTDSGISKLIIYREDIDDIVGFLHSSEMFRLKPGDDWTRCIRPVPIVPETMTAQKLLTTFMNEKKSLAVVVDEFGGTSGIVTLEDLVEEIFGDIQDEHDTTNYIARRLPTGECHLSGRMEIEKANELLDLNLPESDEYLTVSGFILHEYQSFPKLNEVIDLGKWTVKVTKMTATKIEEVLLTEKSGH